MTGLTFRRAVFGIALLLLSSLVLPQRQAPEPELKAAILVNMLLFIDWPSQASQPRDRRVLCHVGNNPVAAALSRLDGRAFGGTVLRVQQVAIADIARQPNCHAVYLAPGDLAAVAARMPSLRAAGVFIIGDSPDYLEHGVMLNLDIESGRVVFDVDLKSARKAGFSVSSKMLRLARQVVE